MLKLVLGPIMWTILENVLCPLEKNVYSAAVRWNVLNMSVRFFWSRVWFNFNIPLLIVCLYDLSIAESGVLKSHTIIVLLPIYPFRSAGICSIYLGVPMVYAYTFTIVISSWWIDPFYHYLMTFFFSHTISGLRSILSKYSYSHFILVSTCMEYLFQALHFESVCVLKAEVSLLQAAYSWVLVFLSIQTILALLIGDFNPFNYWYLGTYLCHLNDCFLVV